MIFRKTIIERALELAESGECRTITQIAEILQKERFEMVSATLQGRGLRMQLRGLMKSPRGTTGMAQDDRAAAP